MATSQDTLARLKESGYKMTPQRVAVIDAIARSQEHLTPVALYRKVRQVQPDIGLVTVYRTLNILTQLGLVCEMRAGETRSYVGSPPQHHGHLICSRCGKVVNFTQCNVAEVEQRLAHETGFAIEEHHLDFFGHCRECQ